MGRFMTPDPLGPWAADAADPQSWNFYAYARNNPLSNVDPTGYDCVYFNNTGTGLDDSKAPIDHNSNSTECGKNGGDWVNGTFTGMTADANNDHFDLRSADANGTYDAIATAPGAQSDGTGCTGNCESDYRFNPAPGYVTQQDIAPSAQVFINQVAGYTQGVTHAGNCAGAAALAFSPYTTPDDAKEAGSKMLDMGVDGAKEGLEAASEMGKLAKGARVGAAVLGKAEGVAGKGLAVHSAYKNMQEAGCFGKKE
jgi:uncharacterized protein RhaS with RHS repeats